MGRVNRRLDKARSAGLAPAVIPRGYLPGLAYVALRGTLLNQEIENVYWVKAPAPMDAATLSSLAQSYYEQFATDVLPGCTSNYTLVDALAQDWSVAGGPQGLYTPPSTSNGGQIGGTEAPFIALKIKLNTAGSGRGGFGWKRMGGVPDGDVNNGVVTAAPLVSWQAAWSLFYGAITALTAVPVVVSFQFRKAPRAVPLASPVTNVTVLPDITTQNSRKIGRGK